MIAVYKIINTQNNNFYIGSTKNLKARICHHKNSLKRNKHANKHLQRSYNIYGESCFQFITVAIYDNIEDAHSLEQRLIDKTRSENIKTYNICLSVSKAMLGLKHSKETKLKQSLKAKGRIFTDEHLAKLRESAKNRKKPTFTDNHRAKIAKSLKNNNNGRGNLGKKRSLEVRLQQSIDRKGRVPWNKGLKLS